jgi:hypothetical protein
VGAAVHTVAGRCRTSDPARGRDRWFIDETYVKVAGKWRYVHRAIDQFGQVIDIYVSARRDGEAARRFFQHALVLTKIVPCVVTTDRPPVYPPVLDELAPQAWHALSSMETTGSKPTTASLSAAFGQCVDSTRSDPRTANRPSACPDRATQQSQAGRRPQRSTLGALSPGQCHRRQAMLGLCR